MTTRRFYAQSSLLVSTYDLLHSATMAGLAIEGDVNFYRALAAEQGGPILELACGTGRVALPLAEAGFEVIGVDRSKPMLAIAEKKRRAADPDIAQRLTFIDGDMRDVELGRRFRLVIIAFRSFAHLLTVDEQRRCLDTVRRHLDSSGLFALNVFDPRLDLCLPDGAGQYPQPRGATDRPGAGTHVEVEAISRVNDPLTQVMTETWRVTERTADGDTLREELEELVLRWTYRYELHHLLELAGFDVVAEYSDFAKSAPAYGHELVVVARCRIGPDGGLAEPARRRHRAPPDP